MDQYLNCPNHFVGGNSKFLVRLGLLELVTACSQGLSDTSSLLRKTRFNHGIFGAISGDRMAADQTSCFAGNLLKIRSSQNSSEIAAFLVVLNAN